MFKSYSSKHIFYQIESFINIIAEQLSLFSNSIYLNISQINEIKQVKSNLDNIKYFFVNSLTLIIKHFITSSYDNIEKDKTYHILNRKVKLTQKKQKKN